MKLMPNWATMIFMSWNNNGRKNNWLENNG